MNHQKSQRWTTNAFIAKAKEIHGDKYDYSQVEYVKATIKIRLSCKACGHAWNVLPHNHLAGRGCKPCQYKRLPQNQSAGHATFLSRAKEVHGDAYDYLSEYKSGKKPIYLRCKTCKTEFSQRALSHLSGCGCAVCASTRSAKSQTLDASLFESRCNLMHINRYTYHGDYSGHSKKVTINCPDHGNFKQEAGAHMRGQGCPKCDMSKGERDVAKLLIDRGVRFEIEKRFADCRDRFPLPFDFYLPESNCCIEFDGYHHFYPSSHYSRDRLAVVQFHDKMKTEYCKTNGIGLLRIPFFRRSEMDTVLDKFLEKQCSIKS